MIKQSACRPRAALPTCAAIDAKVGPGWAELLMKIWGSLSKRCPARPFDVCDSCRPVDAIRCRPLAVRSLDMPGTRSDTAGPSRNVFVGLRKSHTVAAARKRLIDRPAERLEERSQRAGLRVEPSTLGLGDYSVQSYNSPRPLGPVGDAPRRR